MNWILGLFPQVLSDALNQEINSTELTLFTNKGQNKTVKKLWIPSFKIAIQFRHNIRFETLMETEHGSKETFWISVH